MKLEDPNDQADLEVSKLEPQLGRQLDASEREILLRIIRLRRELSPAEDFTRFDLLVKQNQALVLQWTLRWRVAVLDTYTDWGDEVIARNAHLIVSVVNLTRLAEVEKLYRYKRRRWSVARHMRRVAASRPGMAWLVDVSLAEGDLSTNLLRRTTRLLKATPELVPYWFGIMRELVLHDDPPVFWSLFAESNHDFRRWADAELFADRSTTRTGGASGRAP